MCLRATENVSALASVEACSRFLFFFPLLNLFLSNLLVSAQWIPA